MKITKVKHHYQLNRGSVAGPRLEGQFDDMLSSIDVAEIYSPPRTAITAHEFNVAPGWGMDITTPDGNGIPWNVAGPKVRGNGDKQGD